VPWVSVNEPDTVSPVMPPVLREEYDVPTWTAVNE